MVEGGSPPDVPGVNYSLIRGLYDFEQPENFGRHKRRSKFGAKRPHYGLKKKPESLKKPDNLQQTDSLQKKNVK